jgi:hypothetical protein
MTSPFDKVTRVLKPAIRWVARRAGCRRGVHEPRESYVPSDLSRLKCPKSDDFGYALGRSVSPSTSGSNTRLPIMPPIMVRLTSTPK